MTSNVYFMNLRATYKENRFKKLGKLLESANLSDTIDKRDLVAVKLHFGEMGNTAFIRPIYLREIVKKIKETGGIPFLTVQHALCRDAWELSRSSGYGDTKWFFVYGGGSTHYHCRWVERQKSNRYYDQSEAF